ncbi:uncharacterized protein HGUI_01839 [Hanseniaspora guilliermondii]|uniref:VPS9 domain-containing protein n=1 Tax=Hanseniaspora guilliermondii TaxID=56406 RepID=A0A1L0CXR7_9ASCO|nr:uncharacterized protein HGUI_01839 [Hanseniaspora guilliermondii]
MSFQEHFDSDNEYADDNINEFDIGKNDDMHNGDIESTEVAQTEDEYKLTEFNEKEKLTEAEEKQEIIVNDVDISTSQNFSNADKDTFDFKSFLDYLKDPRAEPILKYTRSFISQILRSERFYNLKEQQKLLDDFEKFIHKKFSVYEPFKSMEDEKLANAKDCMEKLLTNKLYVKLFSPLYYKSFKRVCAVKEMDNLMFPDDHATIISNDKLIWNNIMEYGAVISLENLETEETSEENIALLNKFLKVFNRELFKMGKFRSPRDKLVCLLNSCKIIFSFLKKRRGDTSLSADDFMPLLIYSILKISNNVDTENYWLLSSMTYIETFRQSEFLRGEESYYLMSFQGALQFILELGQDSLFSKIKVDDEIKFKNKLDERKGFLVAKKIEKEELTKEELYKKKMEHEKNIQEQKNTEEEGLLSSLLSVNWFGSKQEPKSSPSNKTQEQIEIKKQILDKEKEDMESLKEMFPQFDDSILKDVYYTKNKNVPLTIESLLELI